MVGPTEQNRYPVILEPDESGGYPADVPVLPGCVTHGETADEALANAREAITVYLRGESPGSLDRAGARGDLIFPTVAGPGTA
jgi:predicted RNase H-like HicB family nuclease